MLSSSPLPLSPSKSSLRQGNNSVSGSVYAATGISNAGVETREHGVQTEWTKDKSAHSTSRSTASRQQSPSVSRSWRGTPSRRTPRASPSPPSSASALFRAASPLSAGAAGGSRSGSGRGSGGKIRDRPTSKHSISVGRPSGSSSVGRAVSPLPGTLGAVLPTFQQGDGGSGSGGGGEASHVGKRTARVSSSVGEASWSLRGGEGMGSISGRTRSATNRRVRALARGYEELHKQLIALDELVVSAEKGPKDAAKVMKFFQDENNEDAATQADYMAQVVEADTQVLIHILRHLQRAPLGGASMKWRGSTGGSISGVTRPAQGLPSGTPDLRQDGAGSAQLAANSPENASIVRGPAAVAARATPTGATQAASGGSTPTALTDNLEKQVSGAGNVSVSVAGASKSEGGRAGGSNSNDIHSYDVIRGDGSVGDVAGIDREPSNAVSGDGKTPQAGLTEASASLSQQADATNALQQRGSGGWGPGGQQDGGDVSSTGVAKQLSDQHGASPSATHEPSELVGWSTPRPPTQERTRNPAGGRGADSPLPTKGAGKRPKEPQSSLTQSTKKVTPGVALPKVPLRSGRGRGNVGGDGEATTDSGGGAGTLPPRKSGGDTIEVSPTLPKLGVGARRTTPRMSDRERRRPQRIPWQPATIRLDLGEGFGPPEVGGAMTQNIYPHRPSTRTAALPWATFFHRALGQSGLPTVQHVPPQGENNTANSGNETVDRTGSGGGGAAPFIPLAPPLTSSPPFNWARFISSNQHPPRSVTEDGYNNLALDGMAIMARALEPMSPQCVPSPSPPVPPVAKVKETAPANTTGDMEQQSMPESAFSVSGHSLVTGCGSPRGATALPPPPPVGRSLDTYGASLLSYWPSANSYLSQVVYRSPAQSRRRLPNSARSYRTQDSYWRSILGLIDSRGLNNPFLSRLVAPRVVRNRPRWVPLYTSHRHVQRLSAPSLFIGQPRTCVLPPRIRSLRSFAKRLPRRSSLVKRMPSANLRRGELPPPRQPQPEHEFVPIPVRSLGGWHPPRTEKNK
ncbi:hypothetical protein DQ04_11481000 [Trypanosoma grayi]|uniref:hypothetical protein n=1 Tax=Trypanosoma grayi TaxID=71804 RepID=UPI0004F4A3A2|nr:hypothetical protein DQ04_11481000 [Trypanosoma grayi]KEG06959.1 hypothetical protein DQ04_11481000 [Trypanosoma grayi]